MCSLLNWTPCRVCRHYQLDHDHAQDLAINSLSRCVRTRLYFTSESHLHTLLNVLRYPKEGQPCAFSPEGLRQIKKTPELGYLTQVVFRLFENKEDPTKFRCEVLFSSGATNDPGKTSLRQTYHDLVTHSNSLQNNEYSDGQEL